MQTAAGLATFSPKSLVVHMYAGRHYDMRAHCGNDNVILYHLFLSNIHPTSNTCWIDMDVLKK